MPTVSLRSFRFSGFVLSFLAHNMDATTLRNKRAQLRRGKATLFEKAHMLAKVHNIDIALIMYENGRYHTYRSTDQESWPPTMEQIVRQTTGLNMGGLTTSSNAHTPCPRTFFRLIWRVGRCQWANNSRHLLNKSPPLMMKNGCVYWAN